jgi:hypothetical protein
VSLAAVSLALIFRATLVPTSDADTGTFQWCLLCGDFGLSDFLANMVLFLPVAVALRFSGLSSWRTIGGLFLLSVAIELVQLRIPGRASTFGDIVSNTLGAAAGIGLAQWWPLRRRSLRGVIVLSGSVLTALAGAAIALRPSFPPSVYFGQWTAALGQYDTYGGRLLSAEIGGLPLRSWQLEDSRTVRLRLIAGDLVLVRAVAGPPPRRLAPLFSMADDAGRGILLLGADHDDLVWNVRTGAADLRLRQPELRWPQALAAVAPGDTIVVGAWRAGKTYCLQLGGRSRCGLAYATDQLWSLVASLPGRFAGWEGVVGWAFLFLLGLPAGLCAPRRLAGGIALAALMLGAVFVPPPVGLAPLLPLDIAALALGVVAGALVPDSAAPRARASGDGLPH